MILESTVTLSTTINCSYKRAFTYLSNPLNQKEWAIHFFKDIEEINRQIIATVAFGKLSMKIKATFETGILDIYLGDGKPTTSRLINIEDNRNIYNFTISKPKEMPNEVWQKKALPDMQDELNRLKLILESK